MRCEGHAEFAACRPRRREGRCGQIAQCIVLYCTPPRASAKHKRYTTTIVDTLAGNSAVGRGPTALLAPRVASVTRALAMIDDAESGAHMSPLELSSSDEARKKQYAAVARRIRLLLDGSPRDWVSAMATVACELHGAFAYYNWTGFYRHTTPQCLAIGPYQGSHGCLSISFSRGVCGAAATQRRTQLVDDVNAFPGHVACASSTLSEVVVPILRRGGDGGEEVVGVLDVDSNAPAAFRRVDQDCLEALMRELMQGQWTYCP